jgi:hypothetical protein
MSFGKTMNARKTDITEKPKWQIPMRPNAKSGVMEYYLEGEIKERFIKLYPIHSTRRIMTWFGISYYTAFRLKNKLGLQKNMKAIYKEHARDIKRICEANGYYDSIRGKRPSQASIEGTKRLRAQGFNPIRAFEKKHPAKYRDMLRRRGEERKELVRKERLREKYGMERKTKLYIRQYPLIRKAYYQKHAMIKKCNYFSDPEHTTWVCYDSETRRSPRREATAIRHGLQVVRGEDETIVQTGRDGNQVQ